MKRILIAGANSYIGTSFEKYVAQWPDRYHVDTVDMMAEGWRSFSFAGYDAVFHVAGIAHSDTGRIGEEQAALYYRVNTDLAVETAKKAKAEGVRQFIFMSSIIVYGDSAPVGQRKLITRDTLPRPANAYGDSKLRAEQGILPLQDSHFKVVIIRSAMVYGKGSKGNYQVLVRLAKRLPVFPFVTNERSMIYIDNLCEFVRLLCKNEESGIFWPQNAAYTNTSEMIECISLFYDRKVLFVKGLSGFLKVISVFTALVNKAFGSLIYDHQLSIYKENYQLYDLQESIVRSESK